MIGNRVLGAMLAAGFALGGGASLQAADAKPRAVPLPVIPTPAPFRSGQGYDLWAPRALAYVEALKGRGALPPGRDYFVLRFRSGRPDARVTPAQFRQALAHCRQTSQHLSPTVGLIAEWACAGRGALGRLLVLQVGGYGTRITGAVVWVDRRLPSTI